MKALDLFTVVLDNSKNLDKEIREQVYKSLELNSESEKLNEMIKGSLEHFNFNLVEKKFLNRLQEVKEKLIIFTTSPSKNATIDYNKVSSALTDILRKIEADVLISFDDDFVDLANQISKRFESDDYINAAKKIADRLHIEPTRESIRNYLMTKREDITNMILAYNKNIVDSLVKLTPQLVNEMKQLPDNQKSTYVYPEHLLNNFLKEKVENISEEQQKNSNLINVEQVLNTLISTSKKQYNELQRRKSYLQSGGYGIISSKIGNEIGELKSATAKLDIFIDKLSAENYVQDLINKYSGIEDLNEMCNYIIRKEVPTMVSANYLMKDNEGRYGKAAKVNYNDYSLPLLDVEPLHNEIMRSSDVKYLIKGKKVIENFLGTFDYDTNKRLQEEYYILIDKIIMLSTSNTKNKNPNPDPTPSNETAIGNSKADIISLINSNQYYSVLQAIPMAQIDKYRYFINYGLNEIINKWYQRATLAKTYEEIEILCQEFKTIFYNFENYIPMEVADMLKANIKGMEEFLQQNKSKSYGVYDARNNREETQEQKSSMKM